MAFELPEGFIKVEPGVTTGGYNLPPGFVREPRPEPADTDPTFIDGIGTAWDKRKKAILATREDTANIFNEISGVHKPGEISVLTGLAQTAGQYAGFAGDVIGEGIVHTFQTIGDGLEYAFPEEYEGAADGIKEAAAWVMDSQAGQAASEAFGKGYASYSKWKKENPQDAKTFESVVNVAVLFTPYKTKVNNDPVPSFGRSQHWGKGLQEKAVAQKAKTRAHKVQDMLFPGKLDEDMIMRTNQTGINKRTYVIPNASEKEMINNVSKIKGIKYHRGDQYNLNVIRDENIKIAKGLESSLKNSNISIPNSFVFKSIDDDMAGLLKNNISITKDKDIMNFLEGYVATAKRLISEHPPTPAGLLSARKAFDAQLRKEGKDLAFNAGRESAQKTAINTLRRTINKSIHDAVPDKGVRQSLAQQSSLWRATDMMKPKAIESAQHSLGRAWQNVSRVLDLKMGANRAFAVAGGISAVGASYAVMPAFAGGLSLIGTSVLVARGVNSPATKMALGKILTLIDKGLKQTKNGDMIKQLRADRIIVQDLFEMPVEKETKTEK
jgi:hypothetical protein